MHLIEIVLAGSVFVIASGSSMQLWSTTAMRAHQLANREQLEQQIEQDRIQLQRIWRNALQSASQTPSPSQSQGYPIDTRATSGGGSAATTGCAAEATQLLTLASSQPPVPSVHRLLQLSADGQALEIHWSAAADPSVRRDRVVTPAGLGLCDLAPMSTNGATVVEAPTPAALTSDVPMTDSQVEAVSP